jgi:hypothetical protein
MSYDFAAYDKDGRLSVVVEAKRRLRTDAAWATELRRNIFAHEAVPQAVFMVVVPDKVYVWNAVAREQDKPIEIDASSIFAPYFEQTGISPDTIEPQAFEQLVSWWLNDLARMDPVAIDRRLRESGIVEALAGSRVLRQLAA